MTLRLAPAGGWLNTNAPLRLDAELAGQAVLVWFFCASSTAAVDSVDDVRKLCERFAGAGLRVVGAYAPQYRAEGTRRHAAAAVARLGVTVPVAVDTDRAMFRAFEAKAWPTLVLLDAERRVISRVAGAGSVELLTRTIDDLLGSPEPPPSALKKTQAAPTPIPSAGGLCFPTAVYAQTPSFGREGRVFIADAGHARVIDATWPTPDAESRVRRLYDDFVHPAGFAFDAEREQLYVSDAGAHTIRRIDARTGQSSIILGDGARGGDRRGGATGTNQPLSTPTALHLDLPRQRLFVAMTGLDQIWSVDLNTMVARAFVGSGEPGIVDAAGEKAKLWQPRALAASADGRTLFCLDADGSALRGVDLASREVRTLIGTTDGQTGNTDGPGSKARLCYPTGITKLADSCLVIADAYNHALRRFDPANSSLETIGAREALFEPRAAHWSAALASRTEPPKFFVCDTGNHRVLFADEPGAALREMRIGGLVGIATSRAEPERAAFNVPLQQPLPMIIGLTPSRARSLSPDAAVAARVSVIEGRHAGRAVFQCTRQPGPRALPFECTIPAEFIDVRSVLLVELSLALDTSVSGISHTMYKSWRVRFGADGGEPRLMAE